MDLEELAIANINAKLNKIRVQTLAVVRRVRFLLSRSVESRSAKLFPRISSSLSSLDMNRMSFSSVRGEKAMPPPPILSSSPSLPDVEEE